MERDGNLDDVSLHTGGMVNDGDRTVVSKELGDSQRMQFLETEYVTSSRGMAREVISMATNLPIHGGPPEFSTEQVQ